MTAAQAKELVRQAEAVDNSVAILCDIAEAARARFSYVYVDARLMTGGTQAALKKLHYRIQNDSDNPTQRKIMW
jgi:hypothetical protein